VARTERAAKIAGPGPAQGRRGREGEGSPQGFLYHHGGICMGGVCLLPCFLALPGSTEVLSRSCMEFQYTGTSLLPLFTVTG